MVKATKINLNPNNHKAVVDLFADTKAEMDTVQPEDILDFPNGYTIDFGSSVFTAGGELGFMQSDGTWNWGE